MSCGTTLGTIGIALDCWPRKTMPKLQSVGTDPDQRFYLLATYCFETARKLEYVYKATRRYALEADPALAAEIKADYETVNAEMAKGWKQAAEASERILLRLLAQTVEDHEKILNLLAHTPR